MDNLHNLNEVISMNQLKSGAIYELIKPIVDYINGVLAKLVPNGEVYLVAFISIIIAYTIKSKNNWSRFSFIVMSAMIFAALRFFGVGGV